MAAAHVVFCRSGRDFRLCRLNDNVRYLGGAGRRGTIDGVVDGFQAAGSCTSGSRAEEIVRLTLTAKLVVRVTRPEILHEHAADAQRAMAEAHSPDDLAEFAYLAVTSEGLDEIAEDPAGQLRSLLNASDLIGGICGIAIEKSDLSVEVTPHETVELTRQRHSAC